MNDAVDAHISRFVAAFGYPFTSTGRTVATFAFAAVTYALLILSSFPTYSMQMLTTDLGYLDEAIVALTANTYQSVGAVALGLIVVYAVLTGIALTTAIGRIRHAGGTSARGLSSVLPGLLASGCASCGAGLLGTLGFVGALSMLPFDGNLLRLAGLLLLVAYLSRLGDPRRCTIPSATGGE
ncbi:hypothetical protein [Halorientalis regularis]|jgi:hypothetical protein|uniref:Uncharacterized protein n=1 Tax=Halorientalis regularis TaxID=660518 RepID=A0A1G7PA22_9EURY|nr:hypothetical protein [Halorientalis regularis]SDF83152.1 hypothetical protein SAMN05216218_11041 [Halorientalis regularis]